MKVFLYICPQIIIREAEFIPFFHFNLIRLKVAYVLINCWYHLILRIRILEKGHQIRELGQLSVLLQIQLGLVLSCLFQTASSFRLDLFPVNVHILEYLGDKLWRQFLLLLKQALNTFSPPSLY